MPGILLARRRAPRFHPCRLPGLRWGVEAPGFRSLFEGSTGTTPADADGDPVGQWADLLGLVHFTLEDEYKMDRVVDGALKLCHANRQPVAICLTQLLHGGKLA